MGYSVSVLNYLGSVHLKSVGGGRKTGAKPARNSCDPPPPKSVQNLHDPPQIQYGICMTPPPDKIKTLYLRSEFNEHLYHISHNAMTSVMYFKQFGTTTLF